MSETKNSQFTAVELHQWQLTLAEANRHNIFCHCRHCEAEWVDSSEDAACPHCRSNNIERIPCWQFPDD